MTLPQAKTALRFWLGKNELYFSDWNPPTWDALHRNGWLEPTGEVSEFPNGNSAVVMRVTKPAAVKAARMLADELAK